MSRRLFSLVLGVLASGLLLGSAQACKRRLLDFLPEKKPRNLFEEKLWVVYKNLETCYETLQPTPPDRHQLIAEAAEAWREAREAFPSPPPELPVGPEEYRLIQTSMDHYLARVVAATEAEEIPRATEQAVGMQHIVGEFYANNPGTTNLLNALPYTFQTFALIPSPSAESMPAWRNRLALARLRILKWLGETGMPELARLDAVKATLRGLDELGALLDLVPGAGDRGLEPAQSRLALLVRIQAKKTEKEVYRISAHGGQVIWQPRFLPRYLSKDDPDYNPRAY